MQYGVLVVFGVFLLFGVAVIVVVNMKSSKAKSLIKRVFAGVTLIAMSAGLLLYANYKIDIVLLLRPDHVRVEGKVVEIDTSVMRQRRAVSKERIEHCRAVVAYVDQEGDEHTVSSAVWNYPCTVMVGETMGLTYDPDNPERATLHDSWALVIEVLVLSVAIFISGILVFLGRKNVDAFVRQRRFR